MPREAGESMILKVKRAADRLRRGAINLLEQLGGEMHTEIKESLCTLLSAMVAVAFHDGQKVRSHSPTIPVSYNFEGCEGRPSRDHIFFGDSVHSSPCRPRSKRFTYLCHCLQSPIACINSRFHAFSNKCESHSMPEQRISPCLWKLISKWEVWRRDSFFTGFVHLWHKGSGSQETRTG
jgi:hypothetical protein